MMRFMRYARRGISCYTKEDKEFFGKLPKYSIFFVYKSRKQR